MNARLILLVALPVILAGCISTNQKPLSEAKSELENLSEVQISGEAASKRVIDSTETYNSLESSRLGMLSAGVETGRKALKQDKPAVVEYVLNNQSDLLSDQLPSQEQLQKWKVLEVAIDGDSPEAVALAAESLKSESTRIIESLSAAKKRLSGDLEKMRSSNLAMKAQIAAALAEAEDARKANEAALASARDENIKAQQKMFNSFAGLCGIIALALVAAKFFLQLPTTKPAALVALGVPVALAVSQLVGKSWFLPAAISIIGILLFTGVLYLTRVKIRDEGKTADLADRSVLMGAFTKVVLRLDDLYKDKTLLSGFQAQTVSDFIDSKVFSNLGMTEAEKTQLHKLRMLDKEKAG